MLNWNGSSSMKEFKVIIETSARRDILEIRRYIAKTLKEPAVAKRIYEAIKAAALTLDQNPMRHAVVLDEPYASLGVRPLPVENYIVFYIVDEHAKSVHIIRVVYNRREWQNVL